METIKFNIDKSSVFNEGIHMLALERTFQRLKIASPTSAANQRTRKHGRGIREGMNTAGRQASHDSHNEGSVAGQMGVIYARLISQYDGLRGGDFLSVVLVSAGRELGGKRATASSRMSA